MLQYVIAGLVLGGIYAIVASGLVVTYQSAGILNFGFGAIAYTIARFYYFLNSQHAWPIVPAALVSILVLGPLIGLVLYFGLFQFMHLSSTLIKVMATVGISVGLPALDNVIFGTQEILSAPGLAPEPVKVYEFFGVAVTLDQVIVYACVVTIMVVGFVVLRYTDVGLQIRALVDSRAMTSLSGTNPGVMSAAVWTVSSALAGLSGILVAPIIGLDAGDMTLVMVAALAAVTAARFRNLPVAAAVGLGMGIVSALLQDWLPDSSIWTADLLSAIPFIVMAGFLVYFITRSGSIEEARVVGGTLDRAITPQGGEARDQARDASGRTALSWRAPAFGFAALLALPLFLHSFWLGLIGQGVAYGVIFLSFSLVTGEGGMIWLCQASFAAAGGMATALLTQHLGIPVLLSLLIGGFIAIPFGLLIGLLTIRMGDLYVVLVTLTFGLLAENVVFNREIFSNQGSGVNVAPPNFASGDRALVYLCIGIFALVAIFIVNIRRSTTGLGLTAVRTTGRGASTLGVSVLQMKLLAACLAAFVAGIGGGLLAMTLGVGLTSNYTTLGAEVWLVVLVTNGIRSNAAAVFAGLSQTLLGGVALVYLPKTFGNFIAIGFGFGALAMVKFPEGVLTEQARRFRTGMARIGRERPRLYARLKIAGVVSLVVLIVLVRSVESLWWLWLAVAALVANVVVGYLFVTGNREARGSRGVAGQTLALRTGAPGVAIAEPRAGAAAVSLARAAGSPGDDVSPR